MLVYKYDVNYFFTESCETDELKEYMTQTPVNISSESTFYKPKFDKVNQIWTEGWTQEEIDAWNEANKAPQEPNKMEVLEKQLNQQESAIGLLATQIAKNTLLQNGGMK